MQVLWGLMSPNALQDMMALLLDDMLALQKGLLDTSTIKEFADIGKHGKFKGNVWRDLKDRVLPKPRIQLHWKLMPLHHIQMGSFWRTIPHSQCNFPPPLLC